MASKKEKTYNDNSKLEGRACDRKSTATRNGGRVRKSAREEKHPYPWARKSCWQLKRDASAASSTTETMPDKMEMEKLRATISEKESNHAQKMDALNEKQSKGNMLHQGTAKQHSGGDQLKLEKANESLTAVAQNKELLKEIETLKQTTEEGSESNNSGDDASGDVKKKALENKNTPLQQANDKLCAENEIGGRIKLGETERDILANGRDVGGSRFAKEGWRRLQIQDRVYGNGNRQTWRKGQALEGRAELRRAQARRRLHKIIQTSSAGWKRSFKNTTQKWRKRLTS